ncbi:MAG: glycosyl hydrolase family 8 [Fibromonadales bacterium]|nr:glycosyl hydrolase family 8 [Fibromonadales bacterium]
MKNRFFSITCCSLLLLIAVTHSQTTVNYPYPQRKNYGNGTINTDNSAASNSLKAKFETFLNEFYVTGTCGGQNCARIKFGAPGDPTETVSEGIAYGMIMMVYFSDKTKSYQDNFDRLWRYYKQFSNDGIMNWKIKHGGTGTFSDGSATGTGGATDAEYDAALSLIMAYYQFGGDNYLTEARSLIGKIWSKEHNTGTGMHYPGSQWQSDYNPSYVAPAAYELFKSYGTSTDWTKALSANYTFLKNNQNGTTGLVSGWADVNGNAKVCGNNCGITTIAYDQDAVRAPWRWATANAWFGHADAKTLLNKLGTWVNGKDPSTVKGPITLTGTMGENGNSSYVGSLACALTNNASYQNRLNEYWSVLNSIESEPYFNQALRILTGLLITGNMPNLKACKESSCGTDMGSGGGDGDKGTAIDRFKQIRESDPEDSRGYAATWESWYVYTDEGAKGKSTVTNQPVTGKDESDNCATISGYRTVMQDDGEWVAKIPSYNLDKGCGKTCTGTGTGPTACPETCNPYAPFVAIGLDAKKNGSAYNLTACTEGFSYEYKGQGHNFKVLTKAIIDEGSDHFTTFDKSTGWMLAEVPIANLKQPTNWGEKVDFKLDGIYGFAWEVKAKDDGTAGVSELTGNLAIKNFRCLGSNLALPSKPNLACSDWDDNWEPSRIGMSLFANSNALIAMHNTLNVQVTGSTTLQVFDLMGNAVRTLKVDKGSHVVSLSDLPRGMYIVKASNASWNKTAKLTVK